MLRIDVLTIFPGLFETFVQESILGIAHEKGCVEIAIHDLRNWATDRHRTVDDTPYGGGPGMVMKPEPLVAAIEALAGAQAAPRECSEDLRDSCDSHKLHDSEGRFEEREGPKSQRHAKVILLSPQGKKFDQAHAECLSREAHLVLVCGRYEGVDQRAIDLAVDEEISIGDYVLCGGEIPAMAVIEAVARLIPGVLGNAESLETESFRSGPSRLLLLEGPQYTRPAEFRGLVVPEVLRSGDHGAIRRWREEEARRRTKERRPDLGSSDSGSSEAGHGKNEKSTRRKNEVFTINE